MAGETPFSVCVYGGSRAGKKDAYAAAAAALGREIARRGWRTVYGGGDAETGHDLRKCPKLKPRHGLYLAFQRSADVPWVVRAIVQRIPTPA